MTWVKIDDKLTSHPKWVGLTLEAKSLWFHAAVWCGAHNNDGVLPGDAMPLIAFTASVPAHLVDDATARLVKSTLWARRTRASGGGFEISDWLEYQPSKQQVKDRADAQELNAEIEALHDWLHKKAVGRKVKALINARDGGWCRYCGEVTRETPGDRRSPHRKTYDLVDPMVRWDTDAAALTAAEMEQIAEFWAIACGWCNAVKRRRTPDEAGMALLEPPSSRRNVLPRSAANGSRAVPVVGPGLPGSAAGSGRDGARSRSGGGQQ
jgi:hypothetical protein